ncbi:MAG: transcription antitermination factor NusB [Firmicutes bacterium]|jgi:N utilization substance protein B|nr:transcription antitermination factor NusB [Bacillota bacterium]
MARHRGRELALRVLFEQDLAHTEAEELLRRVLIGEPEDIQRFTRDLVLGTLQHRDELDAMISQAAIDWKLHRMPTIDRNILRLATFEIVYAPDTPISVIINEALELAQDYSTDDAKKFVNGVLATLSKSVRPEGDRDKPANQ